MAHRASAPFRLDISGLEPRVFDLCRQNAQTIVGSRRGRSFSQDAKPLADAHVDLAAVPKEDLDIYSRILFIVIDFERAYGRGVVVRIFEHSPNRIMDLFSRRNKVTNLKENITFFVNGVKVFSGVPNSFSELDEAIDNTFGRNSSK
jgi:hypothetical protein